MDFIERWFDVSPDGGNGSLEAVVLLLVVAVVCAAVFRLVRRRRSLRHKQNTSCYRAQG